MGVVERAIKWMEDTAKDDKHGYDQAKRWGPDYDCSAAVITAWQTAGVPVKDKGATYSGNMLSVFKKCGFKDVTKEVTLSSGKGLKRGDVLLCVNHHAAMYCGNGKEVEASINENGKTTGGKTGDQTGKEFLIRSYRNYPWTNILRYPETTTSTTSKKKSITTIAKEVIDGKWSNGSDRKKKLEAAGYDYKAVQAEVNNLLKKEKDKNLDKVAKDVIKGKYGNGAVRVAKLIAAGYNPVAVQKRVNALL